MKPSLLTIAAIVFTCLIYASAIALGLHARDLALYRNEFHSVVGMDWQPLRTASIPDGPEGDSIRRGARIFNETPLYAAEHTGGKLSCANCHAEGGMQPWASPMVGVPKSFPQFNARAGHVISLQDRIQECFVRSENGTPLDYRGEEMQAVVSYIQWLSTPEPQHKPFRGRGFVTLPDLKPDPMHGAEIYTAQCAGCHGDHGQGILPQFPPLWGDASFNDGAGMYGLRKMAAFVQHNMPQNRMGILTPQEAYDVAGYIRTQPRPPMNPAYSHF